MSAAITADRRPRDRSERHAFWALADSWTITVRELTHLTRQPSLIAWQLGFPIVSVLLFVYVFGSAMEIGGGADYLSYAMPGMFAMTMAFGFMAVIAVVIGWRSDGGLPATLGAFALLIWLRFALIWIGVVLGLAVRNQEAAGQLFAVTFPFGMVSSVFTPPSLMPGWLGAIAMWNPVSSTANAVRELFGNPVATGGGWIESNALLMAVVWPLLIVAVFLPLAVRQFHRQAR